MRGRKRVARRGWSSVGLAWSLVHARLTGQSNFLCQKVLLSLNSSHEGLRMAERGSSLPARVGGSQCGSRASARLITGLAATRFLWNCAGEFLGCRLTKPSTPVNPRQKRGTNGRQRREARRGSRGPCSHGARLSPGCLSPRVGPRNGPRIEWMRQPPSTRWAVRIVNVELRALLPDPLTFSTPARCPNSRQRPHTQRAPLSPQATQTAKVIRSPA